MLVKLVKSQFTSFEAAAKKDVSREQLVLWAESHGGRESSDNAKPGVKVTINPPGLKDVVDVVMLQADIAEAVSGWGLKPVVDAINQGFSLRLGRIATPSGKVGEATMVQEANMCILANDDEEARKQLTLLAKGENAVQRMKNFLVAYYQKNIGPTRELGDENE